MKTAALLLLMLLVAGLFSPVLAYHMNNSGYNQTGNYNNQNYYPNQQGGTYRRTTTVNMNDQIRASATRAEIMSRQVGDMGQVWMYRVGNTLYLDYDLDAPYECQLMQVKTYVNYSSQGYYPDQGHGSNQNNGQVYTNQYNGVRDAVISIDASNWPETGGRSVRTVSYYRCWNHNVQAAASGSYGMVTTRYTSGGQPVGGGNYNQPKRVKTTRVIRRTSVTPYSNQSYNNNGYHKGYHKYGGYQSMQEALFQSNPQAYKEWVWNSYNNPDSKNNGYQSMQEALFQSNPQAYKEWVWNSYY